jgi:hypothetical protein
MFLVHEKMLQLLINTKWIHDAAPKNRSSFQSFPSAIFKNILNKTEPIQFKIVFIGYAYTFYKKIVFKHNRGGIIKTDIKI